jgi:hypothetical protein
LRPLHEQVSDRLISSAPVRHLRLVWAGSRWAGAARHHEPAEEHKDRAVILSRDGVLRKPLHEKKIELTNSILKLLFASDVPLGCLNRSVAKQKLNLFEFAPTTMTQAGTGAAIMPHAA